MVREETDVSNLVLELRPGDTMIVNGAAIRFHTKSRLELTAHVRFLFGKQVMSPAGASSPARRLYLALQSAYTGAAAERERGLADARVLAAALKAAADTPAVRDLLDQALAAAKGEDGYQALKLARQVIQHEDAVLGVTPVVGPERPARRSGPRPDRMAMGAAMRG